MKYLFILYILIYVSSCSIYPSPYKSYSFQDESHYNGYKINLKTGETWIVGPISIKQENGDEIQKISWIKIQEVKPIQEGHYELFSGHGILQIDLIDTGEIETLRVNSIFRINTQTGKTWVMNSNRHWAELESGN